MDSTLTYQESVEPPPLATALKEGAVIAGRFTVESLAGRGGMGIVYRASDALSGQRVALKLMHLSSSADASRRFTREAEFLSTLRHPGIVSYVAHGRSEQGRPFLRALPVGALARGRRGPHHRPRDPRLPPARGRGHGPRRPVAAPGGVAAPHASAPVLMDEVTAGLLRSSFQLTRAPSGHILLRGEQPGADESHPLLGKPTPCVGREHELALLDMTFSRCVEESTAQAVLMTAPAGVGKSRLRHEFLRRLERHVPPPLVLLGRGDPMSAGSADGLLGQALRRLCGISGGEPLEERRVRLEPSGR